MAIVALLMMMMMTTTRETSKPRASPASISRDAGPDRRTRITAAQLCFRFPLSYRDVEDLLAERGVDVSYETIRRWALKFGQAYARKLRQSRPRPDDWWHLDEVFSSINGKRMYLWRAVDSEGEVLDILVQSRRNKKAALKLMRKLLKKQGYAPNKVVTDKTAILRGSIA